MNRIHRTVWNQRRGAYMVAAETTRSLGKSSGTAGALLGGVLMGAVGVALPAHAAGPAAAAMPTSAQVTAGQAQIGTAGKTMTIIQGTDKAAINWGTFSIGKDATVQFVQPSAGSVALNRVIGTEGSVIDGALKANGQVFVLNPNGVLFGKDARVDTAGLVATTLKLSDADFLAGKTSFAGHGGSVVNQGSLTAQDGGYIALIGQQVRNDGVITARLGTVALASGNKVSLNFNGNALVGVVVDEGALDALVANGGAVRADGGLVVLTARGAEGLVNTLVNNTGEVRAQTIENKAGRIVLLGEGGKVEVAGTLDASAPGTGHGGSIETSGSQVNVADATHLTALATQGASGTWLIDPTDFTVAAGSGARTASGIGATALQTALGAANVTIQTASTGTGNGDINVNAPVAWSANKLTLEAYGNINVNAVMAATGSSTLDLKTGYNFNTGSPVFDGTKTVNMGMAVDSVGASTFTGRIDIDRTGAGILTINNQAYTLINSLGAAADASSGSAQTLQGMARTANLTTNYALAGNIDATATSGWNSGAGFTPIGIKGNIGAANTPYSGTFNGLGHTIDHLTISSTSGNSKGMFGDVSPASGLTPRSLISNVGLTAVSVSGAYNVGALIGEGDSVDVDNVFVSGTVTGTSSVVGGIVGEGSYLALNNAHVQGTVSGPGNSGTIGGLVGETTVDADVSVSGGLFVGTVSGYTQVGGLIGSSLANSTFVHSKVGLAGAPATTITASGDSAGGLIGSTNNFTIVDAQVVADVQQTGSAAGASYGGLVGYALEPSNLDASISNSTVVGNIGSATAKYVGGLVGQVAVDGGIDAGHGLIAGASQFSGTVTGTDKVGGLVGAAIVASISNSGAGTSVAPVTVSASGLNVGGLIGQTGALSCTSCPAPTLYGGSLTLAADQFYGSVSGSARVGGLAGYALRSASITGSGAGSLAAPVTVAATSGSDAGGLIGFVGLTGSNSGGTGGAVSIDSSHFNGSVSGTSDNVGGLIGSSTGAASLTGDTVGDTTAHATVSSTGSAAGGLIGATDEFSVSNSHAYADVSYTGSGSGATGYGGLIGKGSQPTSSNISLLSSDWTGTLSAPGVTGVGGLVGALGYDAPPGDGFGLTIAASHISGTVTGGSSVGGLVGLGVATTITGSTVGTASAPVTITGSGTGVGGLIGTNGKIVVGVVGGGTLALSADQFNGTVQGGSAVGGFAGTVLGLSTIAGSSVGSTGAAATLTATGSQLGGLVGNADAFTITNTQVVASVMQSGSAGGAASYGGFIGQGTQEAGNLAITGSSVNGTVGSAGVAQVGGLVGNVVLGTAPAAAGIGLQIASSQFLGTVAGAGNVGGFLGQGLLTNVSTSAVGATGAAVTVTGSGSNVGGVVGQANVGTVDHVQVLATVSGTATGQSNYGGFVGSSTDTSAIELQITNSSMAGNVTATGINNVGGLVGILDGGTLPTGGVGALVQATTVNGAVSGGASVGGLIGVGAGLAVTASSVGTLGASAVTGTGAATGGLIGGTSGTTSVSTSTVNGTVSGSSSVGGLIGSGAILNVTGSSFGLASPSSVVGTGAEVGGLIGTATGATTLASDSVTAPITSSSYTVGGFVGGSNTTLSVTNAQMVGDVSGGRFARAPTYRRGNVSRPGDVYSQVGGLVGRANNVTIADSTYTGNVLATSVYVGGLVGTATTATISNSAVVGNVTSGAGSPNDDYNYDFGTGGLVGRLFDSGSITGSTVHGNVTSPDSDVGGLAGYVSNGLTVTGSSVVGNITSGHSYYEGGDSWTGGLVGEAYYTGSITNSHYTGTITSTGAYVGGLAGEFDDSTISGSTVTGNVIAGANASGYAYTGGLVGSIDGTTLTSNQFLGNVTARGAYVGGLLGSATTASTISTSGVTGNVTTTGDDGSGGSYTGGLVGYLDSGSVLATSHMTGDVTGSAAYVGGMVGYSYASSIHDTTATGHVTAGDDGNGTSAAGGAAGGATDGSDIANVSFDGTVTGTARQVGGLVGLGSDLTIDASVAHGIVTGLGAVGGLVGQMGASSITGGSITQSSFGDAAHPGQVIGTADSIGGLVGLARLTTISQTSATGSVTGGGTGVGGLVGLLDSSSISRSSSAVNVVATDGTAVGGLVGDLRGQDGNSTVETSYATGTVNAAADVGGLVGLLEGAAPNTVSITDAYARGNVGVAASAGTAAHDLGGLVGHIAFGTVTNTYSTGTVTGAATAIGGLVGGADAGAAVVNSFWDVQTSAIGTADATTGSAGGTAKITADMNTKALFTDAGWNFTRGTGIWGRRDDLNDKYPVLRTFGYSDQPELVLTLADMSKVYGDANPSLAGTGITGCASANCVTVGWSNMVSNSTGIGRYAYSRANLLTLTFAAGDSSSNYDITFPSTGITITPRTISVAPVAGANRAYDGTAVLDGSLLAAGNVVNGDVVSLVGQASLSGKDAGTRSLTDISQITEANPNYSLTGASYGGTVAITPLALTITGSTAAGKTYDGSAAAAITLGTVSGFVGQETVTATGIGAFDTANAGNRTATVLYTLADGSNGGLASNYVLLDTTHPQAVIAQRPVTVDTVANATKVYDGLASASPDLFAIDNVVPNDAVHVSGPVPLASKNIGQYTVSLPGLALDNPNYVNVGSPPTGSISVTPRTLNVGFTVADKLFNGDTVATTTARDDRVAGDQIAESFGSSFGDILAGRGKPVTIANLALTGTDAGNYQFAAGTGTGVTGNMIARPLTYAITPLDATKTYKANGQVLVTAAELDQVVALAFSNTVDGVAPGAVSYTIWLNGRQVSDIHLPGRYEIRAEFTPADPHYVIADTGNTLLTLVVNAPDALLNTIAQAVRTNVPVNTAAVLANAGVAAPRSLVDFSAMPPNVATSLPGLEATFGDGVPLALISSPSGEEPSEGVTMEQAKRMVATPTGGAAAVTRDIRVPVSRNSLAEIVNGGVKLPGGVDQLLFVVKADK